MEETTKRKRVSLTNELIQGKELAKQLSNHIILSSNETNEFLIDKIISTYQKALTMLNVRGGETKTIDGKMKDSHSSFTNESPKSEVIIDQEFNHNALFKKRKSMPKWKEQVKICTNTGLFEGSLDDEYSWRKYGQKDILGAKFSRGYYRCTHRNGQGCLATKQVQRSDEDPTIIEVTYRGRHTCTHPQAKPLKREFHSKLKIKGLEKNKLHNDIKNQLQTQETSFTSKAELDVKRKDLEETKEDIFPWFCFPSPSIGSENEIMMESNFFGLSEYQLGYNGLCQNGPTSESDITETVSAPTSVTNSPILDLDILLQRGDFDTDFPFNTPEYFSS